MQPSCFHAPSSLVLLSGTTSFRSQGLNGSNLMEEEPAILLQADQSSLRLAFPSLHFLVDWHMV